MSRAVIKTKPCWSLPVLEVDARWHPHRGVGRTNWWGRSDGGTAELAGSAENLFPPEPKRRVRHLIGDERKTSGLSGGHEDAIVVLYETHVPRGVSLARLLTGDDHLAEDVAHDAFLKATGRFAHLRRADAFDAYYRRPWLTPARCATVGSVSSARAWKPSIEKTTVSPAPDPSERFAMWDRIATLPFRQRAVVVLRYYEDLPLDQAATVLGCSTRAARSLHTRAIESLRRDMAEEER